MKKFLVKVVCFLFCIAIFDCIFGVVMGSIIKKIDIGGAGRDNFICNKVKDDVLIFGSSRAELHYNAQMMTDSLGVSCYNCGEINSGIILAYGRLLMILERYTPKSIIYEVTPKFDYLDENEDNHKFLKRLKFHYDRKGIDSIFYSIDPSEKYKMLSSSYQYNSSFFQYLIVFLSKVSSDTGIKGFRPFNEEMDTMKVKKGLIYYDSRQGYQYDSLKIEYLHKFLNLTKEENINVIFVMSPVWYKQDTLVLEPIKNICEERNISLIDFSNNPKYVHNNKFFKDGTHLNARGADEFSRDLISALKTLKVFQTELRGAENSEIPF